MVDASPQGGHDFELMLMYMVRKVDLPGLQVDSMTLEDLRELTLEDRIDNMEKERELMGRISDRLMDHVAPPVQIGLGKGRAPLPLKFRALLHAMMLMVGKGSRWRRSSKASMPGSRTMGQKWD